MKLNQDKLREELADQDFELIEVTPGGSTNTFDVSANKLHAVDADPHAPVYVPIAVRLRVTLDDQSQIKKLEEETPDPGSVADSEAFVKTLLANQQISGLAESSAPNPTHQLVRNSKGQQVLKRRNFSAY